jgi:hypothetical protein
MTNTGLGGFIKMLLGWFKSILHQLLFYFDGKITTV